MSKVNADPFGATDMTATSSSGPTTSSSVLSNITLLSSEWEPSPDFFNQIPVDSQAECFAGNFSGALREKYAMNLEDAYTFDAEDRLPANQSATAFEMQGVLFTRGFGGQGFTSEPWRATLDGTPTNPIWNPTEQQRCVQATWRFSVASSLRSGTFKIDPRLPDTVLLVQSAALIYVGESNSEIDTLAGSSTAVTLTAVPSAANSTAKSSSSPNLGVIIPAILVPVIVIAGAIVAFVFWRKRQQRRKRLAPSAAFRQDHAATIARGVEGGGRGASPVPSNAAAYIPLDEKRAFNFST